MQPPVGPCAASAAAQVGKRRRRGGRSGGAEVRLSIAEASWLPPSLREGRGRVRAPRLPPPLHEGCGRGRGRSKCFNVERRGGGPEGFERVFFIR